MNIADFFAGIATGIVGLFLLSFLTMYYVYKRREYFVPRMMMMVRKAMTKSAANASTSQQARQNS